VFHDDYPLSHGLMSPPTTLLALVAIGGLLVAAWRLRARAPLFAFAVAWFFAGHLIESTVWPLELYFEHRNYLPMIGPLFALVAAVASAPATYRRGAWLLLGVWLAMSASLTALSARTWGDRGTLASVWLRENPHSVRAVQMMASYQYDRGNKAAARHTIAAGLDAMPAAGELAIQVVLLDCYTRGITQAQYDAMLSTAARMHFSHLVPELAARFGEEARGNRCKGTLPDGGFRRLVRTLVANPAIQRNRGAMANLYVELSKQAAHDGDLNATIADLDAAFAAGHNPLVARNQAIYLLTAGLPGPAMEYLKVSEEAPQPLFKAWLLDLPAMNRRLWRSARRMQDAIQYDKQGDPGQHQP
jgi:hypothetical protein